MLGADKMPKCCKCVISLNKLIGIILTSFGGGMLLGAMLPWWGIVLAIGVVGVGVVLIIIN